MSTKMLQRVLSNAERGIASYSEALQGARAELEAIQQMAKTITTEKLDKAELRRAAELMQAIAKDAP